MITLEDKALAEEVVDAPSSLDPDGFDWRAHYQEKFEAFTTCARTWRQIAHTAQLAGEADVVAMAVTNALENEMFARDAAAKIKLHS